MAFALSEHIRSLRKARGLTQEQLAEALGVTAGAVYKWESRLSLPELPMLVQLADFFDTSVDALIGYTIKDNRRDATLARLMDLRHAKDLRGVDEAERAVMRYPNCFAIVYQAAVMMQVFGLEQSDKALTARALELYERALLLTEQNTNSEISELTIHVAMAECDLMLGRKEKALETLKANNPMGLNNTMIGMWAIAHCDRAEEAENYLSRALLENVSRLFTMTMGFLTLYEKQKRWNEARELARWMLAICEGLVRADEPSSMVKSCAMMAACVGVTERGAGDDAAARHALEIARAWAERFDADPCYDVTGIRFVNMSERATFYDDMGATATEAIEKRTTRTRLLSGVFSASFRLVLKKM